MTGTRQFSLGDLLLVMFSIALAVGFARLALVTYSDASTLSGLVVITSIPASMACFGAAVGGLFGRLGTGALWGLGAFVLYLLFSPGVR